MKTRPRGPDPEVRTEALAAAGDRVAQRTTIRAHCDPMDWPSIDAARRGDRAARVPFKLGGEPVGSVARDALPALVRALHAAGVDTRAWRVGPSAVELDTTTPDEVLAAVHAALRADGLIPGWRDESIVLWDADGQRPLARIERAAARWWGSLTLAAHLTGWVAGDDGRPAAIWIARRALTKATDPGRLDNMVAGGVPAGQTPWQALQREGWEEAGFDATTMARARPGRRLLVDRAVPEGWQRERVDAYELALPPQARPSNVDGEVSGFERVPVAQAAALAAGDEMTVDAALVTLEFLLRHGLLAPSLAGDLEQRAAALGLWA